MYIPKKGYMFMNNTTFAINAQYDDMSKSEKQIADWLLAHPGEILPLSIIELAEKCGCSEATVFRFAKRLGFSGYQGLKISLAQETKSEKINTDIYDSDSASEIYKKVSNHIYITLEKTRNTIDFNELERVADAILKANRIVIFGLGNSAPIALDASHKMIRAGINATAYSDNHMQAIAASQLTENDLAIGVSHSGSSKDIVDAISVAKKHGAVTVAVTSSGKSHLSKTADMVLCTSSDETSRNILALSSRIAQLAIFDAIYYYLLVHNENTLKAIQKTELSLIDTKY